MISIDRCIPPRLGTSVEQLLCCSFPGSSPAPGGKRVTSTIDTNGVNGEIQTIVSSAEGWEEGEGGRYGGR